ncbi:MAG: hypothetical protein A4E30_00325 [Methanomassiliicoccales archaeon PtaB.Bin215]|nr:MAG: hypothetical protein A4E30_00325 [Methanomassiliicoccales archaeon PtaB.Bin215]
MTTAEVEYEWEDSEALDKLRALIEEADEWVIEFRTPWAGAQEFGTGPSHEPEARAQYWPPLAPLEKWVNLKLGIGGEEGHRVAKAIQYKMHEQGMEANPFARPAVAEAKAHIAEILAQDLSIEAVMKYVMARARENIIADGHTFTGQMESEIYLVHTGKTGEE